jgi:tetratricopeptide (TPR) repeat protein
LQDQAVTAFRAALEVYTRGELPQQWATTQNNLGAVLGEQGFGTDGEEGRQLLTQAVAAERAALEVYTREELPQQWATAQNNLGNALQVLGARTGGEESQQLLSQAVAAYGAALHVYTRRELPQQWATTQNNLGFALRDQGARTGGEEGRQLLTKAVEAFRKSLEVRTLEVSAPQWAQTHANLAGTYLALGEWAQAAQSYSNVLRVDPDDAKAYSLLGALYQDKLFDFQAAFTLHQGWLQRHGEDSLALVNLAEAYFTNGRFAEGEKRIAALLASPHLDASSRAALLALKVAARLAQQRTQPITEQLHQLLDLVSAQPGEFKVGWNWDGTMHFIQADDRLAPARDWLLILLTALQGQNRAAILAGLHGAEASFVADRKP